MSNDYEVIDNFLDPDEFDDLQNLVLGVDFPWYIATNVASSKTNPYTIRNYNSFIEDQLWNWYGVHLVYTTVPRSSHFDYIMSLFAQKLEMKTPIRIKVNFHPYTNEVKEHAQHQDYPYSHKGAVFSLNTCDGFTRMTNGDKVDSVANRIVLFDPSEFHNSTTTSNQKGRYNINFNYF